LKSQGHLAVVPQTITDPERSPRVEFCSHCGARPDSEPTEERGSRVCDSCGFGLLLEASSTTAPTEGDAFLVLDSSMAVCAVSDTAEELLGATETGAVNRHVTEILTPADAEAQGAANFAVAVTWAARGDDSVRTVTVRPTNVFGVRMSARIASCGPPRAALLVFDRR
jgi:hypothetical protein